MSEQNNNQSSGPMESVDQAITDVKLDPEILQARVDSVLSEKMYWFPVRHHSPTTARYLEEAILSRKPRLILIEGPYEANHLIPHVTDSRTKPPIAIYSSFRDDSNLLGLAGIQSPSEDIPPGFACWYPMVAYSPEYIALKTAQKIKAETAFIDLPHYGLIRPEPAQEGPDESSDESPDESPGESPGEVQEGLSEKVPQPGESTTHTTENETERLIVESSFYQKLAELAGFRTWDETWDTLFEICREDRDAESFRREMAYFCAAARATSDPRRLAADGTLERERFMLQTIREETDKRNLSPEQVMIVCGGFHIFLDRSDTQQPPPLPQGTVYTTVVPYSYFRISELSGYAAGNRAPHYYQILWDFGKGANPQDALIHYIVSVIKRGRREGESLSSADAIAVTQTANMLANLRARRIPILDDIHDALVTCCCKGDPQEQGRHLQIAMDAADIGTRVGRVTPELTRLPILNDFYAQLDELGFGEVTGREKQLRSELDKREEKDARRSAFLHRLAFLKIPLGKLLEGPDVGLASGTLFKEKWMLRWSPKIEHALIEMNLYGDTVEAAALTRFEENLAKGRHIAETTCLQLVRATDLDFPNLIARVEEACGEAIDNDSGFASLSNALTSLLILDQYALFRHLRRDRLSGLISRCFDRACFALPYACSVQEDQHGKVVEALLGLTEAIQRSGRTGGPDLDRQLFLQHLRQSAGTSTVPYLCGAFWGILAELREITTQELADLLAMYAKEKPEQMILAGDFLDGLMSVSRTSVMLGASHLISAIEALFDAADWEAFLAMLPKMRSAFERLHERQTDNVAELVAQQYGLAEAEQVTTLTTSAEAGVLIARIDKQVAEIMKHWSFE